MDRWIGGWGGSAGEWRVWKEHLVIPPCEMVEVGRGGVVVDSCAESVTNHVSLPRQGRQEGGGGSLKTRLKQNEKFH